LTIVGGEAVCSSSNNLDNNKRLQTCP
jgi:hypothetical protein